MWHSKSFEKSSSETHSSSDSMSSHSERLSAHDQVPLFLATLLLTSIFNTGRRGPR
jgi:hypothetical protein